MLKLFRTGGQRVEMKKTYLKILYLYPAFNNTYVFLGVVGLRADCVTHVDKDGNILFEHIFPNAMDTAGMMSQNQFILLETRSRQYLAQEEGQQHGPCITILNLQTYKFKRTPHHFLHQETYQSLIRCFAETKYLCIQQDGQKNDDRFKLSYYQYPLSEDSHPINVYQSKDKQWACEHIVNQANHHSMMAWFKARHDNEWQFKTYDLRDDPDGKLNIYRFKQQIGIPYKMKTVQVELRTMWQTTKGSFMLVCTTNKTDQQKNKQLNVVQNNYICDTLCGTIRQAKFGFGQLNDYLIDQTNFGEFSMFRTFAFKDDKPLNTPVYYIDNRTQQILDVNETWQCSYLHKDQQTGVAPNMLIHNQYENGDCDWFICEQIHIKQYVNQKQITLQFLLHLNENFDDDLLQDTVQLIDYDDN